MRNEAGRATFRKFLRKGDKMRLTAFIMAGVLLSGAAAAEEVSKPESSLKANFRRVGLELSSTNVANAAQYQDSPVSQLSADGQTVTKGVFDFVAEYSHGNMRWNNGVLLEYGKIRLEPYDEPSESNETADKILAYTEYAHRLFNIYSADFGPMLNAEYQTEFTANDGAERTRVYRGKAGMTIFDWTIVKDLYFAGVVEYDITYPEHVNKFALEAGWRLEYKPADNLLFTTDGYYRRYLSYSQYVPEDFRYDFSANARMDASLNSKLSLGPFLSYRRAHSRQADAAGSNFTIGIAFSYKNVFDLL